MELLTDLKTILHSKRANIYYLEMCRVMQKDGRVVYLSEAQKDNRYWNLPIANTTCLLLGTGTSITQAAMRMLSQAGVLVGFCGAGGTPLLSAVEIEWFTPQSEYRPTEYVQRWLSFWFDEARRLEAARYFQRSRTAYLKKVWRKERDIRDQEFAVDELENALSAYENQIESAPDTGRMLQHEAALTKHLYKYAAERTGQSGFTRDRDNADAANAFLNHGNYLAYGLAATALWVLGIPHGFAVMHGKTRRGALVFDVADLIKDAIVLPFAFIAAKEGWEEQEFRSRLLHAFVEHSAMDFMIEQIKSVVAEFGVKP